MNHPSGLVFHCRRSLDQFGYPSLSNTSERDIDQILFKAPKVVRELRPRANNCNEDDAYKKDLRTWLHSCSFMSGGTRGHRFGPLQILRSAIQIASCFRFWSHRSFLDRILRLFRSVDAATIEGQKKVLTVDQLWCWVLNEGK